jgi:hypothetical protein
MLETMGVAVWLKLKYYYFAGESKYPSKAISASNEERLLIGYTLDVL